MPHETDWRELIPALDDVYMFQGSLCCEDCGEDIRARLRKEGKAPEDEDDEESFDSDDFPKGPFGDGGGEADSVHHCDSNESCLNAIELPCRSKIGAWLGNDLTDEGADWLARSVRESIFRDDAHGRQVNRLWSLKYGDRISRLNSVEPATGSDLDSPLAKKFIAAIGGLQSQLASQVWSDQDSLYGFRLLKAAPRIGQPASLLVWRSDVLPDGSLDLLRKVELPPSEAREREPRDILEEMIEDCAWD